MGDVLSPPPQSFGLRPPTGGYDSSDLQRRSQTTIPYIREVGLLGGRILGICFDLGQNGWHNRSLALCP